MAADETDSDTDSGATPDAKKKAANRQRTLVGVGVVGLILTFLLLKRSGSQSNTGQQTPNPYAYQTGASGYGQQNASELQYLQNELSQLQYEMAGAGSTSGSSTATAPPPTAGGASVASSGGAATGPLVGAGYGITGSGPLDGYSQIGGAAGYNAAVMGGESIYYQPAPGVFEPVPTQMEGQIITSGTPYTNTPTFLKA